MRFLSRVVYASVFLAAVCPPAAFATNGSFLIGSGAMQRAMGGVGVALPLDATALGSNPALASYLGMRGDFDVTLFSPKRLACTQAVPECATSGATLFALPSMGFAASMGHLAVGFVAGGVGGGSTRYGRDIFVSGGPSKTQGVDLKQMELAPTVAYRFSDPRGIGDYSVGFSPIFGIQTFRAYGLGTFITPAVTANPGRLTNQGTDWAYGYGGRIGFLARFLNDRVSVGAVYTSKIYMSDFTKYSGLFSPNGRLNIPANYAIGFAVKPVERLTVAFDVERILYSDVPALGNSINITINNKPNNISPRLGQDGGGGFGWSDQTVYKLGAAYNWSPALTLRAGLNYGKSPIPNDDNLLVATLAPATTQWHATVGFTYRPNPVLELSFAYMHAFAHSQSTIGIANFPISPGGGAKIEMVQNSVDLGIGMKF